MAIACFRLVTLRPELLRSVPAFFRCIADFTRFDAAFPYFAMGNPPSAKCAKVMLGTHATFRQNLTGAAFAL